MTRIVVAMVFAIIVLVESRVPVSLAVFFVECGLALVQRVPTAFLKASLRILTPLAISATLMTLFFYSREGPVVYGWFHAASVDAAWTLFFRIYAGLGGMVLLFVTTDAADLALGLEQKGLPASAAYLLAASYNLVPAMLARVRRVRDALRARGADFQGPLWRRVPLTSSLAIPVIVAELLAAEQRAAVLMVRAFGTPGPKTSWREIPEAGWEPILRGLALVGGAVEMARPALHALGWWP